MLLESNLQISKYKFLNKTRKSLIIKYLLKIYISITAYVPCFKMEDDRQLPKLQGKSSFFC
jgi:hypothetical protein